MIALGVTMDGQKIPLGFVESATENERVCRGLIQDLIRRGLRYDQGLLVAHLHLKRSPNRSPQPYPNSGCGHIDGGRSISRTMFRYPPERLSLFQMAHTHTI